MQIYAFVMTGACCILLAIIAGLGDKINYYQRFIQELNYELDEMSRKNRELKAIIKRGE